VGFKLGRWHDVGWWQLALQPKPDGPELPRSIQDVRPNWDEAMAAVIALLRK